MSRAVIRGASWSRLDRTIRVLLAVALVGLVVRIGYVALVERGPCVLRIQGHPVGVVHSACTSTIDAQGNAIANDQLYYNAAANWLARGHGFTVPDRPNDAPAADHPPLTVVVLAAVSFVFDHVPLVWVADRTRLINDKIVEYHVREQRYFLAFLGAVNVLLIGLLARRLAGDRAAVIAAGIAALYPNVWVNDGLIFSETIAITVVVAAMLIAVAAWREPTPRRCALLGVMCGLAALARAEQVLLVALLALPVAWFAARRDRIRSAVLVLGGAALLVGPWVIYNNARFHDFTLISTNDGLAMGASNCDPAYYTGAIGLTILAPPCTFTTAELAAMGDQSQVSSGYRHRAISYMHHHLKRLPLVVAARVARTWSLYKPVSMITYNEGESRERWVSWLGLACFYPLALAAIGGVVALWRRRSLRDLAVLLAPAIAVTIGVASTYGQVRFRAVAEPSLVVLAAVALAQLIGSRRHPVGA
jgi:4-amino-4-deoxy-L-arabinose transferase-like glycosyltransferase